MTRKQPASPALPEHHVAQSETTPLLLAGDSANRIDHSAPQTHSHDGRDTGTYDNGGADHAGEQGRSAARDSDNGTKSASTARPDDSSSPSTRSPWVVAMSMVLLLCVELGAALLVVPSSQILEAAICDIYHHRDPTPLALQKAPCQDREVQGRLAAIRGWASAFAVLPPLLVSIPYGLLADRYSRKLVLALSVIAIELSVAYQIFVLARCNVDVPDWALVYSGLFLLVGGGPSLLIAMVFTAINDNVKPQDRAVVFGRISALSLFSQLIGGPLSGLLIESLGVWSPMWIGFGLMLLAIPIAIGMPAQTKKTTLAAAVTIGSDSDAVNHNPAVESDPSQSSAASRKAMKAAAFLYNNRDVSILLLVYGLVRYVEYCRTDISLQYMTSKYGWTWSMASYMASFGYLTDLIVLLAGLPTLERFLSSRGDMNTRSRTDLLCRGFAVALVAGNFIVAMPGGPGLLLVGLILCAAGQATVPLLRASMNARTAETGSVAVLNTSIAMVEQISMLAGAPAAAALLRAGFGAGRYPGGLVFLVNSLLGTVALLALLNAGFKTSPASGSLD